MIKNVLCISDLHCGSSFAIATPGVEKNDGTIHQTTPFQDGLLEIFEYQLDRVFEHLGKEKFVWILGNPNWKNL